MTIERKRLLVITLIGLLLLAFSGVAFAMTVWVSGTVTKGPWVEKYRHIEVNNEKYTLMPGDVRIERLYLSHPGIWQREDMVLGNIRVGQKIMINVQGHRIYQILIEE
ncbi:MAG: hypothetical protein PVH99_14150 [Desulfobacteraceae bacterium]